jgi:hypothetical protein
MQAGSIRIGYVATVGCVAFSGGTLLTEDLTPEAYTETATLEWLVTALQYTRSRGQTKVVGYLEEVADDIVLELEMVARRTSLVGYAKRPTQRREGKATQVPLA